MDVRDRFRRTNVGGSAPQGADAGLGDGVADRAELQGDEVVELVAPVRRGGQPESAAGRDLPHSMLEGGGGHGVTLVDHHQPVVAGPAGDVVATGEGLQGGDVDDAGGLAAPAAALPGLHAEQFADAGAPLVGEGFAVERARVGPRGERSARRP